jgi:hypothetical protein
VAIAIWYETKVPWRFIYPNSILQLLPQSLIIHA